MLVCALMLSGNPPPCLQELTHDLRGPVNTEGQFPRILRAMRGMRVDQQAR